MVSLFRSLALVSPLISYAYAIPNLQKRASGVTNSVTNVNGQTFDYIVVGAGEAFIV